MKIVIGTTRPFHLFHLAEELAAANNDVTVYSYIPSIYVKKYGIGKAKHCSLFAGSPILAAMALQKRFGDAQRSATEKLFGVVDRAIAAKIEKCDVYIGLSGMAVQSLQRAKDLGALAICDRGSSHVHAQQTILQYDESAQQLTANYIQRELQGYDIANKIAVASIFARDSFLANGVPANKIFLNNYGVNLSRFSAVDCRPINGKARLLFVGSWCYQKGCDLFESLLNSNSDITLTHIGTAGDVPFPVSDRFRTLGPIPNEQLPSHYHSSDIFVFPSRQDGFGMVLLEALACGMAVVASKNCGAVDALRAIPEQSTLIRIIPHVTATDLIEAIAQAVNDGKRRRSNPPSDPEFRSNEFSWAAYGARYNAFLSQELGA